MKIAIEGMDGSGKTTVAKAVAERFDYRYVDRPFAFLFEYIGFTVEQIKAMEWKLWETEDEALISLLYSMGLLYGTRCINEENVVYDRHYASNYYWHGNEETTLLHQEIIRLGGIPDLTILLHASVDVRMSRIKKRDCNDQDLSNSAMYDYGYNKMINFLKTNEFPFVVLETDSKTPDEVIAEAIRIISNEKGYDLKKERS